MLATRNQFADKVAVTNGESPFGLVRFDLEVRAADQVHFLPTAGVLNGATTFRAPLLIHSQLQPDKQSNLIARNRTTCSALFTDATQLSALFTCQLLASASSDSGQQSSAKAVLAALEVLSVFDKATGFYACQTQLRAGHLFTVDRELQLELSVQLASGVSDVVPIRVTPSIQVHPTQLQLDQLPNQILTVRGVEAILADVEVTASDPALIEVVAVAKSADQWQFRARLVAAYNPLELRPLFLLVASPRSQQSVRIPIQSAADIGGGTLGGQCSSQPLWNVSNVLVTVAANVGLIISVVVTLAVAVWAFVYLFPPGKAGSQPRTNEGEFRF